MESTVSRRTAASLLAALFAILMALAVAPGMAFAADSSGWAGEHDASKDDAQWTAAIADPDSEEGKEVVFTLYTQYADEEAVAGKEFTRADLLKLAAENEDTLGFGYSNAQYTVDKYVTLDQLTKQVGKKGLTITDQDTLAFTCTDGPYVKLEGLNNDTLKADNKFFAGIVCTAAEGKSTTLDFSDLGTERNAPAVLALSYEMGRWSDNIGKAAGTIWNETSPYYGELRWFCGTTKEAVTGAEAALPGGFNSPSGVVGITVKTPASDSFAVYSQVGKDGAPAVAKNYTRADLEKLATQSAKGFLFNTPWSVGVTTSWIAVDKLLSDAGLKLEAGDTLVFAAPDGFTTELTYDQIMSEKYFYPAAAGESTDTTDPVEVGTVLALNWITASVEGTAGSTVNALASGTLTKQYRLFTGLSEANYLAKEAAGKRFATDPKTLTVIKSENAAPETPATPEAPAANKITVAKTNVAKSFKVAKLKKQAKTIALPKAKADYGTPKWTVTKKDAKKILTLKNGKIQVKKGAKAGTYTIKLKASVAKTAKYEAASSKAVTVKVTVTKK